MAGRYSDYLYYDGTTTALANTNVSVYITDTTTLATLYDENMVAISNPVQTDNLGYFSFYIDAGQYDIYVVSNKYAVISVNELTDVPDNSVSTAKIVDGAVTTAKIADANVTTSKIANGVTITNPTIAGNVTASTVSGKFSMRGDYAFQSSTTNSNTIFNIAPNGSGSASTLRILNEAADGPRQTSLILTQNASLAKIYTFDGDTLPTPLVLTAGDTTTLYVSRTNGVMVSKDGTDRPPSGTEPLQVYGDLKLYNTGNLSVTGSATVSGNAVITNWATARVFAVSDMQTAPASVSDTGTLGEIRFTTTAIYVCIATNTWRKAALSTF